MRWPNLNLDRAWNDLQEIVNPQRLREERQSRLEQADGELARRREEEASIAANLAQLARHPGNEAGSDIQRAGLGVLAALLVVVDMPVQFALNSAFMPQVPTVVWVVSAPFLAIGLAALIHGAIVAFAADHDRPARSIRLARTIAWLSFLLALASAGVLLMARIAGPSMAAQLENLATLALFGAAEGFPLAGGAFSAWLHLLAGPALQKRRLANTQARIRDLEKFITRVRNDEDVEILISSVQNQGVDGPEPVGATR